MTQPTWYALLGVSLFCLGLYGLLAGDHLLRKILALNIMGSGIFLFLVAIAHRRPGEEPDPVPHAMVLTGIVVAVSTTAVGLALARRVHVQSGQDDVAAPSQE